ncbi:MAG: DUF6290 family protein [Elusimicrobia bacterium]|nr:DUF6290 family protein [Candidatus Liberimonas magnetica]
MSRTITLRLDDKEYELITKCAKTQHRPISNFITHTIINNIEESMSVDSVEMAQIKNDQGLVERIKKGHENAKNRKGHFVD